MMFRDAVTPSIYKNNVEPKMCSDCDLKDICKGRLQKAPIMIQEIISLFIDSNISQVSFKFGAYNKQPDWFMFFWTKLKGLLPVVTKELKMLRGEK